jgi:hypothetical protein
MGMATTDAQEHYSAYLLRLWRPADGRDRVCRASIEDAHSDERLVFGTLDDLFDYLRGQAGGGHTEESGPTARSRLKAETLPSRSAESGG